MANSKSTAFPGNLGCNLMHFPSGRYGYVGSIPVSLGTVMPADTSAIIGGSSFRNDAGELCMLKFPVFATSAEAVEFARWRGVTLLS